MRERLFPGENTSNLMEPDRVAVFVMKALHGEFSNGSHVIVKKDYFYVLPMREVAK